MFLCEINTYGFVNDHNWSIFIYFNFYFFFSMMLLVAPKRSIKWLMKFVFFS